MQIKNIKTAVVLLLGLAMGSPVCGKSISFCERKGIESSSLDLLGPSGEKIRLEDDILCPSSLTVGGIEYRFAKHMTYQIGCNIEERLEKKSDKRGRIILFPESPTADAKYLKIVNDDSKDKELKYKVYQKPMYYKKEGKEFMLDIDHFECYDKCRYKEYCKKLDNFKAGQRISKIIESLKLTNHNFSIENATINIYGLEFRFNLTEKGDIIFDFINFCHIRNHYSMIWSNVGRENSIKFACLTIDAENKMKITLDKSKISEKEYENWVAKNFLGQDPTEFAPGIFS